MFLSLFPRGFSVFPFCVCVVVESVPVAQPACPLLFTNRRELEFATEILMTPVRARLSGAHPK